MTVEHILFYLKIADHRICKGRRTLCGSDVYGGRRKSVHIYICAG